jgi:putative transposase
MSDSNELPARCGRCAKLEGSNIHDKCDICHRLEFQESVLCDLSRCIQHKEDFECHAFKPLLKLVGTSENEVHDFGAAAPTVLKREPFQRILDSDKIKYERELALQKLRLDPDSVILELKYHFAWNVINRMPVFGPTNKLIGFVHDTFLGCSEMVRGFVELLYLAQDHVHLYVESDGEISVEEMANKIKQSSHNAIVEEFPFIGEKLGRNNEIWDEAYFVETVG